MPRWSGKLLLVAVLASGGCGTVGNLQGLDKIYGGSRLDGTEALRAGKDLLHRPEAPDYTLTQDTAILIFACIDMPLSVLADTATLPITVPKTVVRWFKGDKPQDAATVPAAPAAPITGPRLDEPPLASAQPIR